MSPQGGAWDERFARDGWRADPDSFLVELAGALPAGRGLDLGSGPGRNSLWLAARGWDMTLVDASEVGLRQAEEGAKRLGVAVRTVHADLFSWRPEESAFDLVIVANLHPPPGALAALLESAAKALRPGGHLYVVGHHVSSPHGPRDPERLLTPERLRAALPGGLSVEALATHDGPADHGRPSEGGHHAPDKVVVAWASKPATG